MTVSQLLESLPQNDFATFLENVIHRMAIDAEAKEMIKASGFNVELEVGSREDKPRTAYVRFQDGSELVSWAFRTALIAAALLLPSLASAQTVTLANISGTITLGGTAQTLAAANPTRRGCVIQNLSSGDLWINDLGGTAVLSQPSIKVPAGNQYICGSGGGRWAPASALSIIGATTAQAFAGREW